jgi:putative SOS response-associated peptidase YedK
MPIKPKPVNNIADLSSFMWRFVAPRPENRCLIPMTGFCEAEGEKGARTRTWFSVKDQPIFAWAGMWKDSHEWGAVYSGLMTDCNAAVRPVHDRMPVLLHEEDYELWLRGSLDDVIGLPGPLLSRRPDRDGTDGGSVDKGAGPNCRPDLLSTPSEHV